jgi:hypothetical protein
LGFSLFAAFCGCCMRCNSYVAFVAGNGYLWRVDFTLLPRTGKDAPAWIKSSQLMALTPSYNSSNVTAEKRATTSITRVADLRLSTCHWPTRSACHPGAPDQVLSLSLVLKRNVCGLAEQMNHQARRLGRNACPYPLLPWTRLKVTPMPTGRSPEMKVALGYGL